MLTETLASRATDPTPAAPAGDMRPHAVLIGSGFGGLAAAVRLGARGYRVTVLEKQDRAGGRAMVFRQDGFVFDAGPTIITAPFLLEELWALCGRKMADDVTLVPLDPFYRLMFADGSHMDCNGDTAAMESEVNRLSPADLSGYRRFMAKSRAIYEYGFEKLGFMPFGSLWDMARTIPKMAMLRADQSVHGLVSRMVKDERLRIALSFHPLFIGGSPFSATAIYCLVSHLEKKYGVHFAVGGTGELVRGLVSLLKGQGSHLRLNAEVAEITVSGGAANGVVLANGETIKAEIVVSNADMGWTYRTLLAKAPRKRWSDRKITRTRHSMSVFVWYFGTNRRYENVPHHTILLGPRYRELIKDIFTRKILAEDFSLYLHRPTATDPAMAPEGCDGFYVLSPVPHLGSGTDWNEMAEPYRKRIQQHLEERLLPGLGEAIVSSRVITPLHFRDELLSTHGAAFGIEPLMTQSAYFRPHNRSEDIRNLFLVGAGTHPGAGVPGVITSAKILDKVVPHASQFHASQFHANQSR